MPDALFYAAWPAHLVRVLHAEGVQTWTDLAALNAAKLLTYKSVGPQALALVQAQLAAQGLALSPHGDWRPLPVVPIPPKCGVYFLHCDGYIKIGHAKDAVRRLRGIETMVPYPVTLVHHVPCPDEATALTCERAFHRQFAALRVRGEWFRLAGDLAAFLQTGGGA